METGSNLNFLLIANTLHISAKVYYPCILQTKKRYVGYSYESVDQQEPKFDAKGIETVRRDSCSAVSKVRKNLPRSTESFQTLPFFRSPDVGKMPPRVVSHEVH